MIFDAELIDKTFLIPHRVDLYMICVPQKQALKVLQLSYINIRIPKHMCMRLKCKNVYRF